uniref:Uncharacterized protein n=1 Tax=Anguilla anguilla TaxID=7936 RepID=A0A0E9SWI3_ANGAN
MSSDLTVCIALMWSSYRYISFMLISVYEN